MDTMDSGDEYEYEPMSTDMLSDICDNSQSHKRINRREARSKICDRIKHIQTEWKGALKSTRNIGKGLNKVFKTCVKEFFQDLPTLDEYGSEVSHFIP